MATVKAQDVKASLEALRIRIRTAREYATGYDGAPKYIQDKARYYNVKLLHLESSVEQFVKRVPEKFRGE